MRCNHCSEKAVIFLGYVGKHQCEKHFTEMFERRFMRTIRETGEIKKGETVAVKKGGYYEVLEYLMKMLQKKIPFKLAKNGKTMALPFSADEMAMQTLLAFLKKKELPTLNEEKINGKRFIKPLARSPEKEITLYAKLKKIKLEKIKTKKGLELEVQEHIKIMNKKYPGSIFKILSSLRYLNKR